MGKVERTLPKVKMLPGEKHRERVLPTDDEVFYLKGASSAAMMQFADPNLVRDVATILLDCRLRPEDCFRLRVENAAEGKVEVHVGKTEYARRRIPVTPRVRAILEMRLSDVKSGWVFSAATKSGHIEPSSLKKQHARALVEATQLLREERKSADVQIDPFELDTLRHN